MQSTLQRVPRGPESLAGCSFLQKTADLTASREAIEETSDLCLQQEVALRSTGAAEGFERNPT